jgi:ATP-dependent RNA helicase DDX27
MFTLYFFPTIFFDTCFLLLFFSSASFESSDIPHVETVINFAFPREVTTYIHRVGRTARAGKSGVSVTLVGEKHRHLMKEVVKRAKKNVKGIKARTVR